MTSHVLGGLAGSWRTLLHMQQRAACGRHGRYLESIKSYQESDSYLLGKKILPNIIPVRFDTTEVRLY